MSSRRENVNASSLRPPGWTNHNGTSGRLYTLSHSASSSSLVNLSTAPSRSDPNLATATTSSNPNHNLDATIHPFNNPSSSSNPFTASSGMTLTAPDNMRRKEKKEAKEKRERNRQKKSNVARLAANALAGVDSEAENNLLIGTSTLRPPSSNGSHSGSNAVVGSGNRSSSSQRPTTPHSDSNRERDGAASPANPPVKRKRQKAAVATNTSGAASSSAQASSSRNTRTSQERERSSGRAQIQSARLQQRPSSAQAGPIAPSSNPASSQSRGGLVRSNSGGASSSARGSRSRSTTTPNSQTIASNPTSRRPSVADQEQDPTEVLTDAPSAPAYIPDSRRSSAPNPTSNLNPIETNNASNNDSSNLSPNGSLSSRAGQSINIYSQLSTLGLPGAEEDSEDPDDLPPPFPENATRPHSPPRPPQPNENGEIIWTEEDRRRQEEAEQYRVPDSPPPAFRSDEEGESGNEGVVRRREERRRRMESARREEGNNQRVEEGQGEAQRNSMAESRRDSEESDTSSDGEAEPVSEVVRLEREAWQADIDAGLSLEERIAREQERRERRQSGQIAENVETGQDSVQLQVPPSPTLPAPISPAAAAHASAQALAEELELDNETSVPASTIVVNRDSESSPSAIQDSTPIPTDPRPQPQSPSLPQPESQSQAQTQDHTRSQTQSTSPSQPHLPQATISPALHNETRLAPPKTKSKHRRVASDSRAQQIVEDSRAASSSRPTSSSGGESKRGKATKIRARPASESHSRFRDDATAAAERRRAVWGSNASGLSVPLAPLLRASQGEHAEAVDAGEGSAPATVPLATGSTSSPEQESDAESSSSEDAWRAEEEAFRAMQKREADAAAAAASAAIASDSDEEEAPLPIPRRDPSTSVSVPRAPPPLVLGRSRGGAAYSSSSASSSDDEDRRNMESSSEDEFEGGSASLHSVPSAISLHSLGETSKDKSEGSPMPGSFGFSLARASSSRRPPDPERIRAPRAFVPSEGEDQMIAQGVASLLTKSSPELESQGPDQSTIKGKGKDKGKAPERGASFYDDQAGIYVPITLRMESPPLRAGHFQEDSGSSQDFGSEDEEPVDQTISKPNPQVRSISSLDSKPQPKPPSKPQSSALPISQAGNKSRESLIEAGRPRRGSESDSHGLPPNSPPRDAVSNRLKGLFGTPLVSPNVNPSSPAVSKSPVLEPGPSSRRGSQRRSLGGREEMESSATASSSSPNLNRKPSSSSNRSSLRRKDSSGSSGFEAPEPPSTSSTSRMTSEERARKDALAQIASLHTPGHPRQDSLAALERMLSMGSRPSAAQEPSPRRENEEMDRILLPQPGAQGSSRLSRQGALVNRKPPQVPPITYPRGSGARPASFINPRSAAAPLPRQSRLPAITAATRHFPPSRNSTVVGAPPPWLSQRNQEESGRLQRPLSPTRSSDQMPPPPLPPRPAGSRVSAMISKFEAPTDDEYESHSGRESPTKRTVRNDFVSGSRPGSGQIDPFAPQAQNERSSSHSERSSIDFRREEPARRRPPPPTPQPGQDSRALSTNPFRDSSFSSRPSSFQATPPSHLQPPTSSDSSSAIRSHPPEPSPRTQALNSLTGQSWSSADAYAQRTPSPVPPPTESFNASLAAAQAATIGRRRGGGERSEPPPVPFRPQHLDHRREGSGDGVQRRDEPQIRQPFSMPPPLPGSTNRQSNVEPNRSNGPTNGTADLLGIAELLPPAPESRSSSPQINPTFRRPLPRPPTMLQSSSTGATSGAEAAHSSASNSSQIGLGYPPVRERPTPQRSTSSTSNPPTSEPSRAPDEPAADTNASSSNTNGEASRRPPTREPSLGITDLDLMVSQLEREGAHYEELAAIGEFLGPAKDTKATPEEIAALPVGRVEVEKRRVNKDGRVKQKLAVVGVRVDKCAICMAQFKVDQMAALLPCQHIFHETCATRLLQVVRSCPVCRADISSGEIA